MRIIINVLFCYLMILSSVGCVSGIEKSHLGKGEYLNAARSPGTYASPDGRCHAALEVSTMGGFLSLSVDSTSDVHPKYVSDDVTGMLWTKENELIYSVSPIYGRPGIYVFDCTHFQNKRIALPSTFTETYPDGTDYFELKNYSSSGKKIFFYYAPDAEKVDFHRFRTDSSLFQIKLDGSEFGPAIEKKSPAGEK
jgi:hypothetical protein